MEVGQWYYEMCDLGYNYRLSDIHCALGCSQLKKLSGWVERRQAIAWRYNEALVDVEGISPLKVHDDRQSAFHLYVVTIDEDHRGKTRDGLYQQLHANGIKTQVHYIPIHLHPYYRKQLGTGPGLCPVAERQYTRILSLPIFPTLTNEQVDFVVSELSAL